MNDTGSRVPPADAYAAGQGVRSIAQSAPIVTQTPSIRSALDAGDIGLYPIGNFYQTSGRCNDCATIRQALWYFQDEPILVPNRAVPLAGFAPGVRAKDDIAWWAATQKEQAAMDYPPLIWIGAPEVARSAWLDPDGKRITVGGERWEFDVVPKIALNRSYYNAESIAFLRTRPLTLRGTSAGGRFIARTVWPEDFRLDADAETRVVNASSDAIRELVRGEPRGGAQSPFAAYVLWERHPGIARSWEGKPILATILNGAQGDDDEAHGGHFAMLTGRVGTGGAIGNWLANNFYTLDSYSEKGIIAAMLPLDNYLADLNSGQGWYRPSYLIVAVLKDQRSAVLIQNAFCRVYNQFYRHQLVYRHPTMNCASISVDVLRAMGWQVPARGATSRALAVLGMPYYAIREKSVDKAIEGFDYFYEDRTRLFPAAAFEEIGAGLVRIAQQPLADKPSALEHMLAEDIEALVFLRVPQIPSSRVWGDYPVVAFREYAARWPSDPALQKIIPVPPRPFPEAMRDPDLLPAPRRRGEIALGIWAALSLIGLPWLLWREWRRRRSRRAE